MTLHEATDALASDFPAFILVGVVTNNFGLRGEVVCTSPCRQMETLEVAVQPLHGGECKNGPSDRRPMVWFWRYAFSNFPRGG